MRIDAYLFEKGYTTSRTKAKELVESARVFVDGKQILKPSADIGDECLVEIIENGKQDFVGRGGIKLEGAFEEFGLCVKDCVCADIGASTGGFTECLLRHGAKKVFAIDSGKGQLAEILKNDKRVVSLEGLNARYITAETLGGEMVNVVVMDVSFISQKLLYPAIDKITLEGADIITLIKPQFEAGRENIGKNGIVKDEKVRQMVVKDITEYAKGFGFRKMGLITSPIKGGSGNIEYLIHFKKGVRCL